MNNTLDPSFNPKVASIVKALAYAENGGKLDMSNPSAGKTGEMKSIFQYTPDTWKLYSKQITGKDNLPMTPENESMVTYAKVDKWVNDGYSTEQIASMWNAGEQRPDAYKQNYKGINKKYGVAYDTPAYAQKVSDYASKFEKQATNSSPTQNPPVKGGLAMTTPPTMPTVASSPGLISNSPAQQPPNQTPGLVTPLMKQVRQV